MSIFTLENNITQDFLNSNDFTLDPSKTYYFLNIYVNVEKPWNYNWFDGFIGSLSYFPKENKIIFRGLLSPEDITLKRYKTKYFYNINFESDMITLIEIIKSKFSQYGK